MHDVFISFSFKDQSIAETIVNILSSTYGISCWICTRDIDGGKRYKKLIPEAIDNAKVVVFLQSLSSVESKEIPKEIGMAFDADKTIIPFKVDDAKLTGDLRYDLYGVEYIDATVPTFDERVDELAKAIKKVLGDKSKEVYVDNSGSQRLVSTPNVLPKMIFCGRDDVICEIHTKYQEGERVLFLYGIGGIGKTQIAKQYAKQHKNDYDIIIYATYNSSLKEMIIAETPFATEPALIRYTLSDGIQEDDNSFLKRKLELLNKLSNEKTLIIIDNFDVEEDECLPLLINGKYRLLITSRCNYSLFYPTIKINPVESIESLKEIFMRNYQGDSVEEDDPALVELIELVNRHTYTIELLAQHMENSGQTPSEMIAALKERGITSLDEKIRNSDMKTQIAYQNLIKMFKVFSLTEEEQQILRYMCLMPLDGVKKRDFKKWAELKSLSTLNALEKRSWLIQNTNGIALHPVVRDVIKHEFDISFNNCKTLVNNLIVAFHGTWSVKPDVRVYYGSIAKSLYNVKNNIELGDVKLYFAILYIFTHLDYYDLCEILLQKLDHLLSDKRILLTAGYYYYIGDYRLHRMRYNEAIVYMKKSQALFELLRPASFELAYVTKHLAHIYHAIYEHKNRAIENIIEAKHCLEQSRKIFESCINDDHPQMGSQWYAEGLNFYHFNDYEKALVYSEKSYKIYLELNGEVNSDTTAPMRVLARIYSKLNRLDDAINMQQRVIDIRGILWGKNQFKYFEQFETLSDIYVENNMIEKGIEILENLIDLIGDRIEDYKLYYETLMKKLNCLRQMKK